MSHINGQKSLNNRVTKFFSRTIYSPWLQEQLAAMLRLAEKKEMQLVLRMRRTPSATPVSGRVWNIWCATNVVGFFFFCACVVVCLDEYGMAGECVQSPFIPCQINKMMLVIDTLQPSFSYLGRHEKLGEKLNQECKVDSVSILFSISLQRMRSLERF